MESQRFLGRGRWGNDGQFGHNGWRLTEGFFFEETFIRVGIRDKLNLPAVEMRPEITINHNVCGVQSRSSRLRAQHDVGHGRRSHGGNGYLLEE